MVMSDEAREKIRKLQATRSERLKAIRADDSLSDLGKQRAIAQVDVELKPRIDALREADARQNQKYQIDLETKLFGVGKLADPSYVIAFRDACDRAEKVKTPAEALTLMARAARMGDTGMAKAVFATAWRRAVDNPVEQPGSGWRGIIDTYLDEVNPDVADDAVALDRMLARQHSPQAQMVDSMMASVQPTAELRGENAAKLAAEADAKDAAPPDANDDGLSRQGQAAARLAAVFAGKPDPKYNSGIMR